MSPLRRFAKVFDPAEPGFVARVLRLGAIGLVVAACLLCSLAYPLTRKPMGRYVSAVLWLQVDQYDQVIRIGRSLVDDYPHDNVAYYKVLAAGYRRSGRIEEQMATYDAAIEALPGAWTGHSQRCWYGAIFGFARDVSDSCDRAVELVPPDNPWAHVRRGAARAMLGDREGAISDIEEGLARWDEHAPGKDTVQPWREWLAVLKAGGEPFDEPTLEHERRRF